MKIIKHLSGPNFYFLLAFVWTVLIFYLCLTESSSLPKLTFPLKDKIVHFVFYFVFVLLWSLKLVYKKVTSLIFILIVAIVTGIVIEFLQEKITDTRTFDWFDIIANSFGAISSFIVLVILLPTKKTI